MSKIVWDKEKQNGIVWDKRAGATPSAQTRKSPRAKKSYFSELGRAMKKNRGRVTSTLLTKARRDKFVRQRRSLTSAFNKKFILGALFVLLLTFLLLFFSFFSNIQPSSVKLTKDFRVSSLIFSDVDIGINISNQNNPEILAAVDRVVKTNTEPNFVSNIYYFADVGRDDFVHVFQFDKWWEALNLRPPTLIQESLGPEFMHGLWTDQNSQENPFLLFVVNDYQKAFHGMREWEPALQKDMEIPLNIPANINEAHTLSMVFNDDILQNYQSRMMQFFTQAGQQSSVFHILRHIVSVIFANPVMGETKVESHVHTESSVSAGSDLKYSDGTIYTDIDFLTDPGLRYDPGIPTEIPAIHSSTSSTSTTTTTTSSPSGPSFQTTPSTVNPGGIVTYDSGGTSETGNVKVALPNGKPLSEMIRFGRIDHFSRKLSIGAKGREIESLQILLQTLNLLPLKVASGVLDIPTSNAVTNLQAINGLPQTGVIDTETATFLNSLLDMRQNMGIFGDIENAIYRNSNTLCRFTDTGENVFQTSSGKYCPSTSVPVCGIDGVTYANACLIDVQIAHLGKCKLSAREFLQDSCGDLLAPVCGNNGITYQNKCYADGESIQHNGVCLDRTFTTCDTLDPVCGADMSEYDNRCDAEKNNTAPAYAGMCSKRVDSTGNEVARECQEIQFVPVEGKISCDIQPGLYHNDVRTMQALLFHLGYQVQYIDGLYDVGTMRELGYYQENNGLKKTGRIDQETCKLLNTELDRLVREQVGSNDGDPSTILAPTDVLSTSSPYLGGGFWLNHSDNKLSFFGFDRGDTSMSGTGRSKYSVSYDELHDGDITMFYTFLGEDMLLIARNPDIIPEIIRRISEKEIVENNIVEE